jgi:uncharacterized membrane protein YkvA (DUF1232 family)
MGKITHSDKIGHIYTGFQLIRNWKSMRCMLRETFNGKYNMSGLTKIILVTGILYIVLPFDFDWIPVIGWLDDMLVAFLLVKRLQVETTRYIRAKVIERKHY